MTERKFTDEDLIKALEHCTSSTTSGACNGCPFCKTDVCIEMDNALNIYALDLINRQRAEIDQLNGNLKFVRGTVERQKAEIERLNYCRETNISSIAELHRRLLTAKAEAIKEFAERVKEKMEDLSRMEYDCTPYFLVSKSFIDKTVKEMAEGEQ